MTCGEAYRAKILTDDALDAAVAAYLALTSTLVLSCAWGAVVWLRRVARQLVKREFAYRSSPPQAIDK